MQSQSNRRIRSRVYPRTALLAVALLCASAGLRAQLPTPALAASQFDIIGFLQSATVSGTGALAGGSLTVNGHVVTVPANTIVILPANALTWAELFSSAPAPYGPTQSGLALNDVPAPMTTYQVHVVGNKVKGVYIAGLITISQDALNSGQGYINFIDYATGEIFVGGSTADRTTGARVALNDPAGRYGRAVSPDGRFTVDADNPTIRSVTGFPMCLPRTDPAVAGDSLCPQSNRQLDPLAPAGFAGKFMMNLAGSLTGLDPAIQAPFEVGDFVTFAGTLVHDGLNPTAGPVPTTAGATYVSAHTIINNISIYTQPGANPAYAAIDVALLGTGGTTAAGATEAAVRTRFEGFTTDYTRNIHLYGIDVSASGATSDRDWGSVGVDSGIVANGGAVQGRWRFRPPCSAASVGPDTKGCIPPTAGVFLPATREVRAVIEGQQTQVTAKLTAANGLIYGQYHAPIGDYIFPEQIPGAPIPPANFETIPFLASGGYASALGTVAGVLTPWPGDINPTPAPPAPPVARIVGPLSVASGGTITLDGSTSTGTGVLSFAWTAAAGTFGSPGSAITTFTAPVVTAASSVTISLTVTDSVSSASASVTIAVNAPLAPTVSYVPAAPVTVQSGTPVSLTASCSDPNVPAATPCTFAWTQTNAGAPGVPTVLVPNPTLNPTISFTPVLAPGQLPIVIQLKVVATNSAGISSAPDFTNVTVNPAPDVVTITSAVYRTLKQRLLVNASSSVVSPSVVLTLQPYLSVTGTTVDPGAMGVMVNNGGGLYSLDIVGTPEPAAGALLTVKSNLGGVGTSPVTKVRQ